MTLIFVPSIASAANNAAFAGGSGFKSSPVVTFSFTIGRFAAFEDVSAKESSDDKSSAACSSFFGVILQFFIRIQTYACAKHT